MAEGISISKEVYRVDNNTYRTHVNREKLFRKGIGLNPALITLLAEGGLNFFRYLKNLGMSKETNMIVLSSKHHFYYDENDLRNVRILVSLKRLNLIKHLEAFLNSLVRILPPETNFIGYFSDSDHADGNATSRLSRLYHKFNSLLNTRCDYAMNKGGVTELLRRSGFEVINMKRMNGLIYFTSLNIHKPADLEVQL